MKNEKFIVLAGLLFMELLAAIDTTGVTVMVPTLQNYFRIPPQIAGWILMAYLIPFFLFVVPMGYLADRFKNPEKVITWSIFAFAISSALCGLSINEYMLITCRIIQGFGAAGMFACEFAIILKYWEKPRRIVEIVITGLALGVLVGPISGGLFSGEKLWRYFFLLGTVLASIGFIAFRRLDKLIPIPREADLQTSDYSATRTKFKFLFTALFWGIILNFSVSTAIQCINLLITLEIQEVLKMTAIFNGLILAVISSGMIAANITGLGSRLFTDNKKSVIVSGALITCSLICLGIFPLWSNFWMFIVYFLFGIGVGVFMATIEIMVLHPLPTPMLAQGNGWILTSMQIGYGLGSFVAPILFLNWGAARSSYILAMFLSAIIIIFSFYSRKKIA